MIKYITTQTAIESPFHVEHSVNNLLQWMKDKSVYGVDTETTGSWNGKNQILSLQIGDTGIQWVLDWQSLSREDKDKVLKELASPTTTKVMQNAKFDLKFFFQEGAYLQNIYDTMVIEACIHAGKETEEGRYALNTLAKKYANMELDKSIRGRIHAEGLSDRVIKYAAMDVECLIPIMQAQHKQMMELKMASEDTQDEFTVMGIENRACLCLALMEYNGMKLDTEKWAILTKELSEELVQLEKQLDETVFDDALFQGIGKRQMDLFGGNSTGINWNSPVQKLQLLQRINPKIPDTSERSVSKHKHEHRLIPLMQRYIKMQKLYNGFALVLPKAINKYTGRIHTSFWQNLKTGRISAGDKKDIDATGRKRKSFDKPNLLQIPSRTKEGQRMRSCFIAEKGYKYVGGDYSQFELRIIAEYSQDPIWLDSFNTGKDLHGELCAHTFKIDLKDVKKPSPFKEGVAYRDVQKQVNFMLSYGGGAFKLADMLQISEQAAQRIIDDFFKVVPTVEAFLNKLANYAVSAKRAISPPPYRRIRWMDWNEKWEMHEVERAGKNHPIQSANADVVKCAMGRIYYFLIGNNLQQEIKPLLPVHDEIQTECIESKATWWRDKLEEIMVSSGQVIIKSIPVVADCKISDAWEK